jgi:hypothetical protein
MRNSNQIDLKTQGGVRAVTVTPGNSVQYTTDAQQSRIAASGSKPGLYNYVTGIMLSCLMTVVRSSGGTTVIYPDQFPRAISSIGWNAPMFGNLLDPTVVNGMTAKHILEFFGLGYQYFGINRTPIPGTDGTYTRVFEIFIPLEEGENPWPHHFAMWLGWLDESMLEIFVDGTATPFGLSGVTITNVQFTAALKTLPFGEIIIPPYKILRKYEQAASAASNGPKLTNVGDAGALQGADDGARLMEMLFSHQVGGFVGSGTADQISAISIPWRDQAQSTLPHFNFARFNEEVGPWVKMGHLAAVDDTDMKPPYIMPTGVASGGLLNDPTAMYTPLVFGPKRSLISYYQKVKGNYPLDGMTFNASQSNIFRVYTRELKQFSKSKVSEMLAAMGVDPGSVNLVAKLGKKNVKPVSADKIFCFPRGVQTKKAA